MEKKKRYAALNSGPEYSVTVFIKHFDSMLYNIT